MRTKTYASIALLIVAGAACALLVLLLQRTVRSGELNAEVRSRVRVAPLPTRAAVVPKQREARVGLPMRLWIPSINVKAAIQSVGLTPKGEMDVPQEPMDTGWYNLGPRPGELGSSVVAGHLDWYKGKTGVFQHLRKLRKGDVVTVESDAGKYVSFIVREIRTYKPNENAADVFVSKDGKHLNLITCGGLWDTVRKMYSERLVVFTDAIDPKI